MKKLFLKHKHAVLLVNSVSQFSLRRNDVKTLMKNVQKSLTIEIYSGSKEPFIKSLTKPLKSIQDIPEQDIKYNQISGILLNGYSEFEPEHSRRYSPVDLVIRFPQLIGTPLSQSIIVSNAQVDTAIYMKDEQNPEIEELIELLQKQRKKAKFEELSLYSLDQFLQEAVPIQEFQAGSHMEDVKSDIKDSTTADKKLYHYKCSCLGGTFDRLHLGHRILLSACAHLTRDKVQIGVTVDQLLKKKTNRAFIENYQRRVALVSNFLHLINPKMELEIVPLNDPVGIAGTTTEAQALFLTKQTEKGGFFVNKKREQNGLSTLELVFSDMVWEEFDETEEESKEAKSFSGKTSSSKIRNYLNYQAGKQGPQIYEHWNKLLQNDLKANQEFTLKWWNIVMNCYSEPWRFYHTLRHISEINNFLDKNWPQLKKQEQIVLQLSAYFHDIIYLPKDGKNEQNSSKLFLQFWNELLKNQQPQTQKMEQVREAVDKIILSTIKHEPLILPDNKFFPSNLRFLDADLSILGTSPQSYKKYTHWVWKEYQFYGKEAFSKGRKNIMSKFLTKEPLYYTEEIKSLLDHQARQNIKEEIESI